MAKGGKVPKKLLEHPVAEVALAGAVGAGAGYLRGRQRTRSQRELDAYYAQRKKALGYAEGGGLGYISRILDGWNEFMLPGGVPDETKRALKDQYPEDYVQRIQDMGAARTSAKEGSKRFAGSALANLYGVRPDGSVGTPELYSTEGAIPGIVDQTMALPAFFAPLVGKEAPAWSDDALARTEQTEQYLREKLGYTEADEPLEYFVEAGGSMAGQPPVPVGFLDKVKAPLGAVAKYAKEAAGPLTGGLANVVTKPLGAAVEFFGPVVEAKPSNYLQGTVAGGALRSALSPGDDAMSPEEAEAYLDTLLSGSGTIEEPDGYEREEVTEDEKIRRLVDMQREEMLRAIESGDDASIAEDFLRKYDPEFTSYGYAKGGKVKPSALKLREQIVRMLSDAQVEEGKGMVPVDPPRAEMNLPAGVETNLPDMQRIEELAAKTGKPNLLETPITRRTVLEGMGAMLNPLDPLQAVDLKLDNLMEGIAPAAKSIPKAIQINPVEFEKFLLEAAPALAYGKGNKSWAHQMLEMAEDSDGDVWIPTLGDQTEKFGKMMKSKGIWQDPDGEYTIHYDPEGVTPIRQEVDRIFEWYDLEPQEARIRRKQGEVDPWKEYQLSGDDDVDYHGGYVEDALDAMEEFRKYKETGQMPTLSPERAAWWGRAKDFNDKWQGAWITDPEDGPSTRRWAREALKDHPEQLREYEEVLRDFEELRGQRPPAHTYGEDPDGVWDAWREGWAVPSQRRDALEKFLRDKLIGPEPQE